MTWWRILEITQVDDKLMDEIAEDIQCNGVLYCAAGCWWLVAMVIIDKLKYILLLTNRVYLLVYISQLGNCSKFLLRCNRTRTSHSAVSTLFYSRET